LPTCCARCGPAQTELGVALAARAWDDEARRRSLEIDGHLKAFETFQSDGWNFYSDPDPDPIDQPSPLFDQLTWLAEAGFEAVDVHWMKAGHALYGGRKPAR
jgi:tRNA (cmo5U34)-methyltransferase